MTDWLSRLPSRHRLLLVFWLLNAMLASGLALYALR
jgi:hypothetical protein